MNDRNSAIVIALEPLALMARSSSGDYEAIRSWVLKVYAEPFMDHDINVILPLLERRANEGFRNERYAFALAVERLRQVQEEM